MRCLSLLLVFFNLCAICLAALSVGQYSDPLHPGKCVIMKKQVLDIGEHRSPGGECKQINCDKDGSARIQTCGIFKVEPMKGCTVGPPDLTLEYPECCLPVMKC